MAGIEVSGEARLFARRMLELQARANRMAAPFSTWLRACADRVSPAAPTRIQSYRLARLGPTRRDLRRRREGMIGDNKVLASSPAVVVGGDHCRLGAGLTVVFPDRRQGPLMALNAENECRMERRDVGALEA